MTPLAAAADSYLKLRRALGFNLHHLTWLLPDFVAFVESHGSVTITAALAVRWSWGRIVRRSDAWTRFPRR